MTRRQAKTDRALGRSAGWSSPVVVEIAFLVTLLSVILATFFFAESTAERVGSIVLVGRGSFNCRRGIPLETDSEGDGGASHAEGEIPGAKGNCRRGLAEWHHLRSEAPRGEGRWDHNSERNRELYWFDVKKIFFRR